MQMTLQRTFQDAVAYGPVLIVAPMPTPDHSNTNAPIKNSPLIGAALLATNLGATRLVFNPAEHHAAVIYLTAHGSKPEMQMVLQLGAKVPAVGFRWCALNSGFFCDEFVAWGQRIAPGLKRDGDRFSSRHVLNLGAPINVQYDPELPAHVECIEQVLHYFQAQAWERAVAELDPPVYARELSDEASAEYVRLLSEAGLSTENPAPPATADELVLRSKILQQAIENTAEKPTPAE